jgi:hypothetical protein
MDIQAPLFTLAELCRATGLPRSAANMWLRRGQIHPTRSEQVVVRKRALFSVMAIFEIKLMQALSEHLEMGPSGSSWFTQEIADAMWSMARESDRGRPLRLFAGVSKEKDRWRWFLELDPTKLINKFAPKSPFAMIRVGEIFTAVYRECQKIFAGEEHSNSKKARRAQS